MAAPGTRVPSSSANRLLYLSCTSFVAFSRNASGTKLFICDKLCSCHFSSSCFVWQDAGLSGTWGVAD
eukprot:CAMPEP_0197923394 /NCGR_PEP_ID=MMETSP1439-20131203/93902_1 /TAXON_ID=66791 /ORGANISM="Gonyaulax spinifera, Strain CCMP409" /LENGTH=67 /DNA_ID=CAMNT_0043545757 /DNA_START=191 /DNA_END=391 /DNA_ORIENTATION=+